jgi:thioredoxin reductase (NADPH)
MGESIDSFSSFTVAIIGTGIAGLYSAYCCGILGLSCCVIDSLPKVGGQCAILYPEKKVYGAPGFVDIKAKDYISCLSNQCLPYAKEIFLGLRTQHILRLENGIFRVATSCGRVNLPTNSATQIMAKYIILATGIGDMKPNVPINIKGVMELKSDFVQYYCMRLNLYKEKNIVVAGGGDSAVDLSLDIVFVAKKVVLIHRRDKLNCEDHKLSKLKKFVDLGKLDIVLETQILEITENGSKRTVITDNTVFETDYIVFCYGFMPSSNLILGLKELGLQEKNNLIEVNINTMETSIEDCYSVGDATTYQNKKKNIVSCFFEADRAVRSIKNKISQEVGKCDNI